MVGSGTTLIEARLLNRNAIGLDVNSHAVEITKARLTFPNNSNFSQKVGLGDVCQLTQIEADSIDLIVTHPPYFNLVAYSQGKNPKDLSSISSIPDFMVELKKGIGEIFRVLKPGKYCCLLIGDTRKGQHYIPLSHFVLQCCLQMGLF